MNLKNKNLRRRSGPEIFVYSIHFSYHITYLQNLISWKAA